MKIQLIRIDLLLKKKKKNRHKRDQNYLFSLCQLCYEGNVINNIEKDKKQKKKGHPFVSSVGHLPGTWYRGRLLVATPRRIPMAKKKTEKVNKIDAKEDGRGGPCCCTLRVCVLLDETVALTSTLSQPLRCPSFFS